jgi:hypothetical protein
MHSFTNWLPGGGADPGRGIRNQPGKRQVLAYYVLLRVAVGFGLPRGWMGLDYDADTTNHLLSMTGSES